MAEFLNGSTQTNSQIYTEIWVQDTCLKLRTGDNFFNGSTLCSSYGKQLTSWFNLQSTLLLLFELESQLALPKGEKISWQSESINIATLSRRFPHLIKTAKTRGFDSGTWLHPDTASPLLGWLKGIEDKEEPVEVPFPTVTHQLSEGYSWRKIEAVQRTTDGFINSDFTANCEGFSVRRWLARKDVTIMVAELATSIPPTVKKYVPPCIPDKYLPLLARHYPHLVEVWGTQDADSQQIWLHPELAVKLAKEVSSYIAKRLASIIAQCQPQSEDCMQDTGVNSLSQPSSELGSLSPWNNASASKAGANKIFGKIPESFLSESLSDAPAREIPTQKARKEKTIFAGFDLELFQMPNGEYYASLTSATEPVGRDAKSICIFLDSKYPKALLGERFEFVEIVEIQACSSNRPIKAIPLNVVAAYWRRQDQLGNPLAQTLVSAMIIESLTQVADRIFGVNSNSTEQSDRLTKVLNNLQQQIQTTPEVKKASENSTFGNLEELLIHQLVECATALALRYKQKQLNTLQS